MVRVLPLVRVYQAATELSQRMDVAEAIVRIVGPELHGAIRHRCKPDEVDPLLNIILKAIIDGLDGVWAKTEKRFRGWCHRIAKNKVNDLHRENQADLVSPFDPHDLEETVEATAVPTPIPVWERLSLDEAMERLQAAHPPCKNYVWDHYILGLDYADLAQIYGFSYDAMRMRIQRCLELARQLVAEPRLTHA